MFVNNENYNLLSTFSFFQNLMIYNLDIFNIIKNIPYREALYIYPSYIPIIQ